MNYLDASPHAEPTSLKTVRKQRTKPSRIRYRQLLSTYHLLINANFFFTSKNSQGDSDSISCTNFRKLHASRALLVNSISQVTNLEGKPFTFHLALPFCKIHASRVNFELDHASCLNPLPPSPSSGGFWTPYFFRFKGSAFSSLFNFKGSAVQIIRWKYYQRELSKTD